MRLDQLFGAGLIVTGTIGIISTPTAPPTPIKPVMVVVARTNLPAGRVLDDSNLELRRVASTEVVPGRLDDMLEDPSTKDHVTLLAPVQAGQQITAFTR